MEVALIQLIGEMQRSRMTVEQMEESEAVVSTSELKEVIEALGTMGISAEEVRFTVDASILGRREEKPQTTTPAANGEPGDNSPTAKAAKGEPGDNSPIVASESTEIATSSAAGSELMAPNAQAQSGEVLIHGLQRELGADNPNLAVFVRSLQGSAAFKTILGTSAFLGCAGVVAPALFIIGTAWGAIDIVAANFGKSLEVILPACLTILQHKMALAIHGINLDQYSSLKYGETRDPFSAAAGSPAAPTQPMIEDVTEED